QFAGHPVAVNVNPVESAQPLAVITSASGDGGSLGVRMRNDRRQNGGRARFAVRFDRLRTFDDAPAVVAAAFNTINHLPQFPADIPDPQGAALSVETHLPRIAEAVGPDFRPRAGAVHERIVGRYAVGFAV